MYEEKESMIQHGMEVDKLNERIETLEALWLKTNILRQEDTTRYLKNMQRYAKALKFYADGSIYEIDYSPEVGHVSNAIIDNGEQARVALAKIKA